MKKHPKIISFLTIFLFILPTLSIAGQFKVTRVYDGDTIIAKGHDIKIKVRLAAIDAPEISRNNKVPEQPFSDKSKNYLSTLILNKTVYIKGYDLDYYNRVLGVIFLDGKNINLEMVKQGLAEVYRGRRPTGLWLAGSK